MLRMNKNKKGQAGFVITVELLLIVTVLVMGLIAGWAKVRDQTIAELSDTGSAIGAIDQSYRLFGTQWTFNSVNVAAHAGFNFDDIMDDAAGAGANGVGGDSAQIQYNGAPTVTTGNAGTFEASVY